MIGCIYIYPICYGLSLCKWIFFLVIFEIFFSFAIFSPSIVLFSVSFHSIQLHWLFFFKCIMFYFCNALNRWFYLVVVLVHTFRFSLHFEKIDIPILHANFEPHQFVFFPSISSFSAAFPILCVIIKTIWCGELVFFNELTTVKRNTNAYYVNDTANEIHKWKYKYWKQDTRINMHSVQIDK